jgi:hypothetical protein|tara:strand:+ start:435 stop:1349 length:915 start_codon:yes stop_codon:yes gene_type:complete
MRRGKYNNKALILVLIVGFFTIISYMSDQLVIRQEDSIRNLNIDYNNLRTKILTYQSIEKNLESFTVNSSQLILNSLKKRNIWVKATLLFDDEASHYSKYIAKFSKEDSKGWLDENYIKIRLRVDLYNNLRRLIRNNNETHNNYGVLYNNHQKLFDQINVNLFKELENLINYKDIFNSNLDKFQVKDFEFYNKMINSPVAFKTYLDKFEIDYSFDLFTLTMLIVKKHHIFNQMQYPGIKSLRNIIEEDAKKLDSIFIELKENSSQKNYYILLSILSQIVSLLFLLLLFRSILMKSDIKDQTINV